MKIMYLIDTDIDNGGAPISTMILARAMAAGGNDVYVVMPSTDVQRTTQGIRIIKLEEFKDYFPFELQRPISFLRLVRMIERVIQAVSPDIIHAQMPRSARAVGVLRMLHRVKNIPIIYTDREYVIGLRRLYQSLYRFLVAERYDKIICLSKVATEYWGKYVNNKNVVVIPNPGGVIYDHYDEGIALQCKLKNPNRDALNIVFVGRMTEEKRWTICEGIVKECARRDIHGAYFHFAISFKNSKMHDDASRLIRVLQRYRNVSIYTNLSQEQMSDLYYISDIHIITSRIESFGRTAIEAMSRKVVVLSTDAGAIRETIGLDELILPADASVFVDRIEFYLTHRDKLNEVKEKLFNRYHQLYTVDQNYLAHRVLYTNMHS